MRVRQEKEQGVAPALDQDVVLDLLSNYWCSRQYVLDCKLGVVLSIAAHSGTLCTA